MQPEPSTDAHATPSLPANACLITRADRLTGDPARSWYFAVMVRASMLRLEMRTRGTA